MHGIHHTPLGGPHPPRFDTSGGASAGVEPAPATMTDDHTGQQAGTTDQLTDDEHTLIEKSGSYTALAGVTGQGHERAHVAIATALVANHRWHQDGDGQPESFDVALVTAARDVVDTTEFSDYCEHAEGGRNILDTKVRAQSLADDLDLPDPTFTPLEDTQP